MGGVSTGSKLPAYLELSLWDREGEARPGPIRAGGANTGNELPGKGTTHHTPGVHIGGDGQGVVK